MRTILASLLVCLAAVGSGCTIRYSQALAGAVPDTAGTPVRSSDTGFSLLYITLSEPRHAHEQVASLMGACSKLTKVEVDYRELFFILFGIPRVTVTGNCVK
jgi:hypothetical protein